jgi:hypothetical protein
MVATVADDSDERHETGVFGFCTGQIPEAFYPSLARFPEARSAFYLITSMSRAAGHCRQGQ